MRIARDVLFRQEVVPKPGGVVVAEPVSPIITMPAKLCLSRLCFECSIARPETKIAATNVHWSADVLGRSRLRRGWRFGSSRGISRFGRCCARGRAHSAQGGYIADLAPTITVRSIKPVIEAVIKPVQPVLLVAFMETGKNGLSAVSL